MEYLETVEFWYWWVAATILFILETLLPGTVFLWMGISAIVVGFILWLMPSMSWEWQFLLFTIFSITSVLLWRMRLKIHPTKSDDENLNQRNKQYIGRKFTLTEPIVDGVGKIYVDDSQWQIEGPDCEKGSKVKVVSADNMILSVEVLSDEP